MSNDMRAASNHRGVSILLGNGVMALRGTDMRMLAADLDAMAELGSPDQRCRPRPRIRAAASTSSTSSNN